MTLGALVDLGADPEGLRRELEKLGVPGWNITFRRDQRGGIAGTHAMVELSEPSHHHDDPDGKNHSTWKDIRGLITGSGISEGAKRRSLAIFQRIAEAEAQIHGTSIESVAFHEVGAMDSIIDIVGTGICLDMLKPDRITCGEIELGGGTVQCAHGVLPVPAPATLLLVQGLPVKTGGFDKEMTTPTGAGILAVSVDEFVKTAKFREIKTGYGIGARKMEKPNVLRVSWREEAENSPSLWNTEELTMLESNIDDMSGEALGFLMERLFDAGALDVTFTPCMMKKSRPGTVVSVLGSEENLPELRRTFFQYSTSIGFRERPVRRLSLPRTETPVSGAFGKARMKTAFLGESPLRSKIEYEDRARIARDRGLSLDQAERLISSQGADPGLFGGFPQS
jgi:uncharacterized protein (TIGR00299 family) protein